MSITRRGKGVLGAAIVALLAGATAAVLVIGGSDGDGGADDRAARRRAAAVTEANNGGEVTVAPSKPFTIDLEGSVEAPWGVPEAGTAALARVSSSQDADGSAAATFLPLEIVPGAKIVAERVPTCRATSPPCDAPTERFEVTVRVIG